MDTITQGPEIWLVCSTPWPTKIFQNLFIQMLHITFRANQRFPHTFPMGKP